MERVFLDSMAVYAIQNCGLTWTPTVPFTSTRVALWNFFSTSWTSGSLYVRPISRFKPPMVLRKFEVSSVFAASPSDRCFGLKETSDLANARLSNWSHHIHARLFHVRCSPIGDLIHDDIDSSVSCNTNLNNRKNTDCYRMRTGCPPCCAVYQSLRRRQP